MMSEQMTYDEVQQMHLYKHKKVDVFKNELGFMNDLGGRAKRGRPSGRAQIGI